MQWSRALSHNIVDDEGAGPSVISATPTSRPLSRQDNISPTPSNRSSKRRRVITPTQTAEMLENLLKQHTENQQAETDIRSRLFYPEKEDKRKAFCGYLAVSCEDIHESLWDEFTQDALMLLSRYKRRSTAQVTRQPPAAASTPRKPKVRTFQPPAPQASDIVHGQQLQHQQLLQQQLQQQLLQHQQTAATTYNYQPAPPQPVTTTFIPSQTTDTVVQGSSGQILTMLQPVQSVQPIQQQPRFGNRDYFNISAASTASGTSGITNFLLDYKAMPQSVESINTPQRSDDNNENADEPSDNEDEQ